MNRSVIRLILGSSLLLLAACPDGLMRNPQGRSGTVPVSGSLRAQSTHYRLMGTLTANGGVRKDSSGKLQDGMYLNNQLH